VKVVRIPANGRPNLIYEQVKKLHGCIEDACDQSRERKGQLRMLLDANELQPYLQFAFDHFACDLNTPFDFVQAAVTNSPIHHEFGANILKLAINIMDTCQNTASGPIIFTELSYMVASCIMLDSARHGIKGEQSAMIGAWEAFHINKSSANWNMACIDYSVTLYHLL
jgi:hypothetical protein